MKNTTEINIKALDALLPQTQCRQCEYEGCLPYATAVITEGAPINRCIPGGTVTMEKIASLLNVPKIALVKSPPEHKLKASVIEALCIGCTKCIQACPVDAIVGAQKMMHTVITEDCTGCELCVPVCPMECIDLTPVLPLRPTWEVTQGQAEQARQAYHARNHRLDNPLPLPDLSPPLNSKTELKAELQAALLRAKQKKAFKVESYDTD